MTDPLEATILTAKNMQKDARANGWKCKITNRKGKIYATMSWKGTHNDGSRFVRNYFPNSYCTSGGGVEPDRDGTFRLNSTD